MDLKGIVTVINTPFDHSGGIDKDMFLVDSILF